MPSGRAGGPPLGLISETRSFGGVSPGDWRGQGTGGGRGLVQVVGWLGCVYSLQSCVTPVALPSTAIDRVLGSSCPGREGAI
jgi:hypothetical protein